MLINKVFTMMQAFQKQKSSQISLRADCHSWRSGLGWQTLCGVNRCNICKVSPTFCGVVDPPTVFVVIFAPTFFVVRYNTLCGQCYNTFYCFAPTNVVVLPSSIYLNDK